MKYYLIAGEASGDLHGSTLMKGIYKTDQKASIRFWGGDLMKDIYDKNDRNSRGTCGGMNENADYHSGGMVRHYKEGAVMGLWEVFTKSYKLLDNLSFCKSDIRKWQPDVVILIDYPGFNLKIAAFTHKNGIRTFYYIAPKVWASRENRIKKLKRFIDRLYIIFPFEINYFHDKGIDAVYKGNPIMDEIEDCNALKESRKDFLSRYGFEDGPFIALLAGSRRGEICSMMPVFVKFVRKMKERSEYAKYRFIVAGAPSSDINDYNKYLINDANSNTCNTTNNNANPCNDTDISVIFGETRSIIRHAEAAVVNSGTASLETVLLDTPQVVVYSCNPLTYLIGKKIIKVKYISLGNLILDRLIFKELIQDKCKAENIMEEVLKLIENKEYREKMLGGYELIRKSLGGKGASDAVAQDMIHTLSPKINVPIRTMSAPIDNAIL